MTPETGTALLILAVFVLPGFVTLLLRERMFAVRGEDTQFERLLNALYYSALIYAIVFAAGALAGVDKTDVVEFYRGEKSLAEDLAAGGIITLALPAAIATIGLWWRSSRKVRPGVLKFIGVSPSHSVSSGWNEAFSREGSPMLRVTLKDGRVVGGYFGDGSLAGYSEHAQDLFISERWSINPKNDWFTGVAEGTTGLWIAREEIASIEFYERPPDNNTDGDQKPPGQPLP
jgi:hypothetical protein